MVDHRIIRKRLRLARIIIILGCIAAALATSIRVGLSREWAERWIGSSQVPGGPHTIMVDWSAGMRGTRSAWVSIDAVVIDGRKVDRLTPEELQAFTFDLRQLRSEFHERGFADRISPDLQVGRSWSLLNCVESCLLVLAMSVMPTIAVVLLLLLPTYERFWIRTIRGDCEQCGYDLRGNFDAGCPECGWRRASAEDWADSNKVRAVIPALRGNDALKNALSPAPSYHAAR